ncbi:MAG: MFS transporter [Gammaproteobacteria bacterium]|jgi:PPP family 3-phenylpropionic acid transporter
MTDHEPRLPYWRLSGFYLFYFGVVGLYMPYWPLYLNSLGLTPQDIGLFFGISSAMRIIAPNVWGWLADRQGRRMPIIRACLAVSCVLFVFLGVVTSLIWLLLLAALFGFFWTASLPQFEAITLTHLGESTYAYTRIRLWGSLGFILTVSFMGFYLEMHPVSQLPWLILLVMSLCLLNSLTIPDRAAGHVHIEHAPLPSVLRQRTVIILLLACFVMQFSHAPYYAFYTLYLKQNGYASTVSSALWSLGVIAEVIAFLGMRRLILLVGQRNLIIWSLMLASLRWSLTAEFVNNLPLLILAQLLHAATFAVFHGAAIQMIHHHFPGRLQGRGQALYSSVSFGLGIALGSVISGAMWKPLGAGPTFLMAAASTAVAAVLCWVWLEDRSQGRSQVTNNK